jgi:hypothetical protein
MLEKVRYERLRELASEKPYRGRVGNFWGWDSRRYGYKDFYVSSNHLIRGRSNPEPVYTLRYYKDDLLSVYPDNTVVFHKDSYWQGETQVLTGMCEAEWDDDRTQKRNGWFSNSQRHGGFTYVVYSSATNYPSPRVWKKELQMLIVKGIRYNAITNQAVDKFHLVYKKRDRKRTKMIRALLEKYSNQAKAWFSTMSYGTFLEERDALSGIFQKENVKTLLTTDPVKAFIVAGMKNSNLYYRTWWGNKDDIIPENVIETMRESMLEELYHVYGAMIEDVIDGRTEKHRTSNRPIEIRKETV